MSEIKEKFIKDSLIPVSMQTMEIILEQMKNCVCKIHIEGNNGFSRYRAFKNNRNY